MNLTTLRQAQGERSYNLSRVQVNLLLRKVERLRQNRTHQFIIDYEDVVKENAESQLFLNAFFNIFGGQYRR